MLRVLSLIAIVIFFSGFSEKQALEVGSRKAGQYGDGRQPTAGKVTEVKPRDLKQTKRQIFDPQYNRKIHVRGVPLANILEKAPKQAHDDLALLKFANGMQIGVPLDTQAFLVLAICEGKNNCHSNFPEITKDGEQSATQDPRPIKFTWNKVIMEKTTGPFSPWQHADSLVSIELVNAAAYDRQFAADGSTGYERFKERCASCHGVRQVGAVFGWDVVGPIPLYEKRTMKNLMNHVKYPKVQAMSMGLMMPAQADIAADEVEDIWRFFRKMAQQPLKAYTP